LNDSLAGVVVLAEICSQIEAVVIAEIGDQTVSAGVVVQLAVEAEMSDEDLEADNQAASSSEVLGIQAVLVSVKFCILQLVAALVVVAARNPQLWVVLMAVVHSPQPELVETYQFEASEE
jgi:hypothetical protein